MAINGHNLNAGQISRELSLGYYSRCYCNLLGTLAELRDVTISFLSGMDGQTDLTDFHEILGFLANISMQFKYHYNLIRMKIYVHLL